MEKEVKRNLNLLSLKERSQKKAELQKAYIDARRERIAERKAALGQVTKSCGCSRR